jgi:hypothetical protein
MQDGFSARGNGNPSEESGDGRSVALGGTTLQGKLVRAKEEKNAHAHEFYAANYTRDRDDQLANHVEPCLRRMLQVCSAFLVL